jgi:putative heme-binding domain-containing protein
MLRILPLLFVSLTCIAADSAWWTQSRVQGTPEPAKPFTAVPFITHPDLVNITDLVAVPGSSDWLIATGDGKLWHATPTAGDATLHPVIDFKSAEIKGPKLFGILFHHDFAHTRDLFLTYTIGDGLDNGTRLSRFKVTSLAPFTVDVASEQIIITWRSGGHNGAALAWGVDHMLYVTAGDSEVPAPADPLKTGQDLSDLLSSVLRLDVDHAPPGQAYAIPSDNPFVQTPGARGEIWAYGLRNPWKLSFDQTSGQMWCGDVGWEQWESIYLIKRGENYGWSATEGAAPLFPERKGTTPITPPIASHGHEEAASITGGFVWRSPRLPELVGAYIYGDYETGKLWALWHDGTKRTRLDEIADTAAKIVTFGLGSDGDVVFAHYAKPSIVYRLERNPAAGKPTAFPRKLSETGLFTDVAQQIPNPGVHPFAARAPMWADGMEAQRFAAFVEGNGSIETTLRENQKKQRVDSTTAYPAGMVLSKTLTLPDTKQRIETQLLHYDGEAWNAYSYRWNDAGTDAQIVGPNGDERELTLNARRYTHRFHSRAECIRCHNSWNTGALSFHPQQIVELDAFTTLGLVDAKFAQKSPARLVNPHDESQPLEQRARSWLHSNCAQCHRENGGGSVPLMLNAELRLDQLRALGEAPTRGDFGIPGAQLLRAGDPWRSVLLHRIATAGAGHMPAIGSHEADERSLAMLAQWVQSLPHAQPIDTVTAPEARALRTSVTFAKLSPEEQAQARADAKASPAAHVRGLLERFLPDADRVPVLGPAASADKIKAARGNAERGAALLTPTGKAAVCIGCHVIKGTGRDFGPELSQVGARLSTDQLIESLLHPSKVISPGYQPIIVTMSDDSVQAGFIVVASDGTRSLKLATGQSLPLTPSTVKEEKALPASLMPEGQLANLTAQEAADLIAYLTTLK